MALIPQALSAEKQGMAQMRFTPRYAEANIRVHLDGGEDLLFERAALSYSGAYSLPWRQMTREKYFGTLVEVTITLLGKEGFSFDCVCLVVYERSVGVESMGLKFHSLGEDTARRIEAHLNAHGNYPTSYSRKYPRLPAAQVAEVVQMRATITNVSGSGVAIPPSFAVRVGDLNPEGLMLETDDIKAGVLEPGSRVSVKLEGTGAFGQRSFSCECKVRRVMHERDPYTTIDVWQVGFQIAKIDAENKKVYFDLLKEILLAIKSDGQEAA